MYNFSRVVPLQTFQVCLISGHQRAAVAPCKRQSSLVGRVFGCRATFFIFLRGRRVEYAPLCDHGPPRLFYSRLMLQKACKPRTVSLGRSIGVSEVSRFVLLLRAFFSFQVTVGQVVGRLPAAMHLTNWRGFMYARRTNLVWRNHAFSPGGHSLPHKLRVTSSRIHFLFRASGLMKSPIFTTLHLCPTNLVCPTHALTRSPRIWFNELMRAFTLMSRESDHMTNSLTRLPTRPRIHIHTGLRRRSEHGVASRARAP